MRNPRRRLKPSRRGRKRTPNEKRQLLSDRRFERQQRKTIEKELSRGGLLADREKLPERSYFRLYKDLKYTCKGCRKPGIWTASQQKRYFEEQKGNPYNQPSWCFHCHRKRMERKFGG